MKKLSLLLLLPFLFPNFALAYDSSSTFCVSGFGEATVNGTYTYSTYLWFTNPIYLNASGHGMLSGSDANFSSYAIIMYAITPISGNITGQQAYISAAGGLTGWTNAQPPGLGGGDYSNAGPNAAYGDLDPAGTVTLGACGGTSRTSILGLVRSWWLW